LSGRNEPVETNPACLDETAMSRGVERRCMLNTIILAAVLVLILGFIFFLYLMFRRTMQGFKEGMDSGRN
jgi:hypothetical protein